MFGRSIRCENFVWDGLSGLSAGALLAIGFDKTDKKRGRLCENMLSMLYKTRKSGPVSDLLYSSHAKSTMQNQK